MATHWSLDSGDYRYLAERTLGLSDGDLDTLCKEAHLVTISEFEVPRDAVIVEIEEKYKPAITMDHLEEALMSTGPSDHLKHIEKFQIKFGSNAN